MNRTHLSVIIPTYNRVRILKETLQIIFSPDIDFDKETMEVIVVNDGTEDVSFLKDLYSDYPIKVVKNKGRGAASARNTGASYAQGEILLFHDDDIIPQKGYFHRHISVCQKYPQAICSASYIYPEELRVRASQYPFGRYRLIYGYDSKSANIKPFEDGLYIADDLAGFSCSMHKSTYLDLGGYNESFPYAGCEDADFSYRANKKGYLLLLDKKNICYHNELDRFDLKRWLWRQATGIKTAVVMCKIHPEGMSHPTWYTNTPLNRNDPMSVKLIKIKKIILSNNMVLSSILRLTSILEKVKVPDSILFRLYNALWLGYTYRSFQEAYAEIFESQDR